MKPPTRSIVSNDVRASTEPMSSAPQPAPTLKAVPTRASLWPLVYGVATSFAKTLVVA